VDPKKLGKWDVTFISNGKQIGIVRHKKNVTYRYKVKSEPLDNAEIAISFEDGKFVRCDFPFSGTWDLVTWKILEEVAKLIRRHVEAETQARAETQAYDDAEERSRSQDPQPSAGQVEDQVGNLAGKVRRCNRCDETLDLNTWCDIHLTLCSKCAKKLNVMPEDISPRSGTGE
jgi:hypothetical protein